MSDYIEPDVPLKPSSRGTGGTSAYAEHTPSTGIVPDTGTTTERGTLDESVYETLRRDIVNINTTLKKVVYPHFPSGRLLRAIPLPSSDQEAQQQQQQLPDTEDIPKHSDLWAPLLFVILYSLFVSHARAIFSGLFVLTWAVLLVMSLHLRLTKPRENANVVSYASLSGYCLFPIVIDALLSQLVFPLVMKVGGTNHWVARVFNLLDLVVLVLCLVWSLSAVSLVTNSRGFIQTFPLGLCLLGLSCLPVIL